MLKKILRNLVPSRNFKIFTSLLFIIFLALYIRASSINWDGHCCQHPDERAIVMFTLPIEFPKSLDQFLSPQSPLNPHFFAYGNFPLYVLKGVSVIAGQIDPEYMNYGKINLVGRAISVFSDLGTILLTFLIGKTLFSNKAGIFASFIYAVSVMPIQYSHFFAVDTLLTFFITLTLYRILKFYQKPSISTALFVGIAFGLSLTTKISAIPLLISISFAIASDFIFIFIRAPHKIKHWLPHVPLFLKRLITEGAVIILSTIITFIILQPYAVIDFKEFISQNLLQFQMTHNAYIFPYTLQYVGKIPYLYELKNLFYFGLGPLITLLSLLGLIKVVFNLKSLTDSKRAEIFTLFTFFVLYFLIIGKFAVGWMRYMLPLYPILAILAGFFVAFIFIQAKKTLPQIPGYTLKVVILIIIVIWPLSFITIYSRQNTRLEASDWIRQNIPQGSTLAVEHWDDRLPMFDSVGYNFQELALYEIPDDHIKWSKITDQLILSDYIIIASNRLYVPLQKLDDCEKFEKCYPLTSQYYKDLFSQKLGFEKLKEFSSFPTIPILGWKIVDDSADESFTVYDHPKIMIFKKTPAMLFKIK